MTPTQPWLKRPALLSGALALTLIGCTTTPPEPVTPPPAPPAADAPTSGLPDDVLVALVHGDVSSPIHDELAKTVRMVPYDGSQRAADHDVLIFDGNHHDPAAHAQDPLVDEALSAGKWVLGVDVDEAHKADSLGARARLGASTQGPSRSYLVRTEADDQGRPTVWIVEAVENAAPAVAEGALTGQAASPLAPGAAGEIAAGVAARLSGAAPPINLTPQQNANVPPGLVYKTINYSTQLTVAELGAPNKNTTNGTQRTATESGYVFNLYLDNADNPDGDFQYVAVESDILTDVTNFTGNLACNGCYAGAASGGYADEYAWFLGWQRASVGLAGADGSLFTMVASSPANTSNVNGYTSSLNFDVGFRIEGYGERFTYDSTSDEFPLANWKLTNQSNGATANWIFRTVTPWNGDQSWDFDDRNDGWYDNGYPREPNGLSRDGLVVSTKALWKSTAVLDRTVAFELKTSQLFLDAYCEEDQGALNCEEDGSLVAFNDGVGLDRVVNIDMGAVTVPVPKVPKFSEFVFSYSPVVAGGSNLGLFSLTDVTPEDLTFNLSSDSPNAVIANKTTLLEKGKAVGSFAIATNAAGLEPGERTTATITVSSDRVGKITAPLTIIGPD